jgi:hypothetical protein
MQLLLHALLSIRITQPVRLKLVRPVQMATIPSSSPQATNGHPNTAHDSAPDQTTQLSPTSTNPMFGRPSLPSPTPQPATLYEPMDWEPSPHTALSNGGYTGRPPRWEPDEDDSPSLHKADWDGFGVGRMREHRVPLLGYRRGRAEGWCWMSGCFNPSRSASPACDFSAPSSP